MNSLWKKIAIVLLLVIVIISYMNFQQIKVNQQQALKILQQITDTKKQSQQLNQQIEVMNTVANNLIKERETEKSIIAIQEKNSQKMINMTYIAQGFSAISAFKVYITEFYMMHGRYPQSNADLKMSPPYEFATDVIRTVSVSEGGVITITYNEKSGIDNGKISFVPLEKNHQIQWKCSTRDYKSITQFMSQCHYNPL